MGGSSPVQAIKKAAKKAVTTAEGAASFAFNPTQRLFAEASKAAGVKADLAFDPGGTIAGGAGESFVDKPKAAKEQAKRFQAETAAANKKFQRDMDTKRKQSDAEMKAGKDLISARKKQDAKRKKGRASTIVTGSEPGSAGSVGTGSGSTLGGAGSSGRKSLLGL